MKIESINLSNFRNFNKETIVFHPKTTVLVGNNGQGKTNILESVYLLSMARSFRVKDEKELIQHGSYLSKIAGLFSDKGVKKQITTIIHDQGKTILVNKQAIASIKSFIGEIHTVLFSPSDMTFFDGSPGNRRKFLDSEGSKCSKLFVDALYQYTKTQKERNLYLKNENPDSTYLDVLDQQMVTQQIEIIRFREEFIQFLDDHVTDIYNSLSLENDKVNIVYKTIFDLKSKDREKHIMSVISESRSRDLMYRNTHVGIHRDDLEVYLNDYAVDSYASQGQKRLLIIAIKLALIEYIKKVKKTTPILLLDDVFSEIDIDKRKQFISLLPTDIQTIITTTDLDDISTMKTIDMFVYDVVNGRVQRSIKWVKI